MTFEVFRHTLLTGTSDEDLDEVVYSYGQVQVSEWLVLILKNWLDTARLLSHAQQDRILWRIGSNPMFIGWWLEADSKLNFDQKTTLLQASKSVPLAIPSLFKPDEPMENGYFMWWDLLCSGISDEDLASECLEILEALSQHNDNRVQASALHGLGHLQHPRRAQVVDAYIARHPEAGKSEWILACRDGTVM